jgi:DNA mismatch endonuclease, patch repair protein
MAASTRAAPSSPDASRRMRRVRQKNTDAESALRRELHALGLRYRVQVPVLTKPRRVADIVFVGPRVAVFVDGCFWHGCPSHATWPKNNADFWRAKIVTNQQRDRDTDSRLRADGWEVVRVWAHEAPREAASKVAALVRARTAKRST